MKDAKKTKVIYITFIGVSKSTIKQYDLVIFFYIFVQIIESIVKNIFFYCLKTIKIYDLEAVFLYGLCKEMPIHNLKA